MTHVQVFARVVYFLAPFWGVTEVWHIAHFYVSYGRCSMLGLPMGWSEGKSRQWGDEMAQMVNTKNHAPFACFWDPYGSLAMLGSPIGAFVGLP